METTKFSSKDNFIAAIHEKTADLNPKYQRDDAPEEDWNFYSSEMEELPKKEETLVENCRIFFIDGYCNEKGKAVDFQIEEIYQYGVGYGSEYAIFGKIKNNGERIFLLVQYCWLIELVVNEIRTSCTFFDIFEDKRKNFNRIVEFKDAILERSRILFTSNGKRKVGKR